MGVKTKETCLSLQTKKLEVKFLHIKVSSWSNINIKHTCSYDLVSQEHKSHHRSEFLQEQNKAALPISIEFTLNRICESLERMALIVQRLL